MAAQPPPEGGLSLCRSGRRSSARSGRRSRTTGSSPWRSRSGCSAIARPASDLPARIVDVARSGRPERGITRSRLPRCTSGNARSRSSRPSPLPGARRPSAELLLAGKAPDPHHAERPSPALGRRRERTCTRTGCRRSWPKGSAPKLAADCRHELGSQRHPSLSSHVIALPSPATPDVPSSSVRQYSPGS